MNVRLKYYSTNGDSIALDVISGHLVIIDPHYIDDIRRHVSSIDITNTDDDSIRNEIIKLDGNSFPYANSDIIGYYRVNDFQPGRYVLNLKDIRKFVENDKTEGWAETKVRAIFSLDTPQLLVIDALVLPIFVQKFEYKNMFLPKEKRKPNSFLSISYFENLVKALKGYYFGYAISPGSESGMDFRGPGTYMIQNDRFTLMK